MAWKIDPYLPVIARARDDVRQRRAGHRDYDSHDVVCELSVGAGSAGWAECSLMSATASRTVSPAAGLDAATVH
jgi:hypothetical protein